MERNASMGAFVSFDSYLESELADLKLNVGVTLGYDARTFDRVFQPNEDRFRHTLVLGGTGTGKSNHVQQMERQDIQSGAGCFILAAHEDDALYALASVPEHRLSDVVLIDAANPEYLPCMNPMGVDHEDRAAVDRAVEDCLELMKLDNFIQFAGPRFEEMVREGVLLLMQSPKEEHHCIANLGRVYSDPSFVKIMLRYCRDEHVREHWVKVMPEEKKSSESGEVAHWFLGKVARFSTDSTLAHVFGVGRPTIDVGDVVDNGKILIAYVPEDRIGPVAARVIAKSLVMQLRSAIMNRSARSGGWRGLGYGLYEDGRGDRGWGGASSDPFFVYVDEFAKFATTDFEGLLAESRKQGVGFVLSTQTLSQTRIYDVETDMPGKLEDAILGNVGTFVCYPMGERDAEAMARQIDVDEGYLRRIRRYQPVARLCLDNQAAEPVVLAVGRRPEPDNPSAPRRIARAMVDSGAWLPVKSATERGAFLDMVADPGDSAGSADAMGEGEVLPSALVAEPKTDGGASATADAIKAAGDAKEGPANWALMGAPDVTLPLETDLSDETLFCPWLSIRTRNCLKRAGIDTLGMLLELTWDDLRSIRNFGPKCVNEVKECLKHYGLSLADGD